jgi:hypothetical protein
LFGKPEGRRPLGRPRRRWKDNIKMDFLKIQDASYTMDKRGSFPGGKAASE